MIQSRYVRYLVPFLLVALGLLLLIRIFVVDSAILLPEDIDAVVILAVLGIAMVTAIHTLVRIWMQYLRSQSVRKARRETLAEHNRFLARLDHELKNPLTTLRAGLSTLTLTDIDEQQQQIVNVMQTETLRLSRLVADLRKLAELEAEALNFEPLDVEEFVENIVQHERDRFEEGQRALTSQVEGTRKVWIADGDLLALAVHNLLDNAFKYTQAGDTVHLSVAVRNDLKIRVSDTGIGISGNDLPHVWEELYRTEQIEKIEGSGIGLTLVKAIAERHGGTVEIESEPEAGTSVVMHLPALAQTSDTMLQNLNTY